ILWDVKAAGANTPAYQVQSPDYAREEGLPYTVLMAAPITREHAQAAVAWVAAPLPPQQLQ
ncbi:MAG: hypothetical protein RQ971_04845, partial [Armatimonadota bacterium]|nr:hypothetical protein [Armatimonadota bacterium]